MQNFLEGLEIFLKYHPRDDSSLMGADHDVIYIYSSKEELHPDSEDGKLLDSLGFYFSEEDDSWSYFT